MHEFSSFNIPLCEYFFGSSPPPPPPPISFLMVRPVRFMKNSLVSKTINVRKKKDSSNEAFDG